MAVELSKVLENLTTKLKGKSVSKTYIKSVATRYAAKIETEADMDEYVNDRLDDIIEAGVEADRRVTAALKKPKEGDGSTKADTKTEVEIDEDELKDAPPYVKAMMKQMKGMSDTITSLQSEKSADAIKTRFINDPKLKGIDPKLLKGRIPTKEDDYETFLEEAYEDLKDFAQADNGKGGAGAAGATRQTDRPGFGSGAKPANGVAGGAGDVKVPDAIKTFTDRVGKQQNSVNNKN